MLDGSKFKMFQSGGDQLNVRAPLDRKERQMRVASKLFFNVNHPLNVQPPDALESCLVFKFPYKFVSEAELDVAGGSTDNRRLQNVQIKDYLNKPDFLDAYTWRVAAAYTEGGHVIPCEMVRQDTSDFTKAATPFAIEDIVSKHFEITGNTSDYVTSKQIAERLKTSDEKLLGGVKNMLKTMGGKSSENCGKGTANGRSRGFQKVRFRSAEAESEV